MQFSITDVRYDATIHRLDVEIEFTEFNFGGHVVFREDEGMLYVFDYVVDSFKVENDAQYQKAASFIESREGMQAILSHNRVRLYTLY